MWQRSILEITTGEKQERVGGGNRRRGCNWDETQRLRDSGAFGAPYPGFNHAR